MSVSGKAYFAPLGSDPDDPTAWTLLGEVDGPRLDLGKAAITTWYLATCLDCTPRLPQPFSTLAARDDWVVAHMRGTGHRVDLTTETR